MTTKSMHCKLGLSASAALLGLACATQVNAQVFGTYTGDLIATFRKTGAHQGTYEMVVNIGNITNFLAMPQGAVTNISTYSPAQLALAFDDGFANLQWGVFAAFPGSLSWTTPLGAFPQATLWFTLPTADANSNTNAPDRESVNAQAPTRQNIISIENGASIVSVNTATNQTLVTSAVIEDASDTLDNVTAFIGDKRDSSFGDFNGYTYYLSFEGMTPDDFSAPSRCDLFQGCPSGKMDPITQLTNGAPYRVGFFQLSPDGTMSFTRGSTNSVTPPPPPPPAVLALAQQGGNVSISFPTTNGATYVLYFTNNAGLNAPLNTWPTLGTLTGNGSTKSFTDTSAVADRFYRISAH